MLLIPEENNDEFTTKIFTNDDHSLKLLGEILSNQVSRDIIRLLIEKEMYANEIASELNTQFSLISHHLKKMEELELLIISEKRIVKKGKLHKHYKMIPGIFLLPNHAEEEIKKNGFLKKNFKKSVKFIAVGIAGISTFIISSLQKAVFVVDSGITTGTDIGEATLETPIPIEHLIYEVNELSIITTGIVIACGLFLIYYSKK